MGRKSHQTSKRNKGTGKASCERSFQEFVGNLWAKRGIAAVDFRHVYAASRKLLQAAKSGHITWFAARVYLIQEMKRINEEATVLLAAQATRWYRANRALPRH